MLRRAALILTLALVAWPASAGRRQPQQMLQPDVADRGWILSLDGRRARLSAPDGARQSFRVRRDERWLGFSEFESGWIATGIRPQTDRIDLSLVADVGRGRRRLPDPPDRRGLLRTAPTPVIGTSGLAGLAWLEGDDLGSFAVRAAAFEAGTFIDPVTVSAVSTGSQTGLSAAVLEDGSWLLVWSRFDGHDDEIYWALRQPGGEWTAPRRLTGNNSMPDITPRLLARGEGAVVAWSRLDGEYEVVTARYANGGWSTPRRLGIRGTVSPVFRRLEQGDYLVVRNAWPAGWTALRLDETGRPDRFAVVAEESGAVPVLRSIAGAGLTFEWPERREAEALEWEPMP